MTLPTLTLVEQQVLVALERKARVAVNGWVSTVHIRKVIPGPGDPGSVAFHMEDEEVPLVPDDVFDRACRRLHRLGVVELWNPGHPPSGPYQSMRRVAGDG